MSNKTLTLPLSGKVIEVVYNNQIEIIERRKPGPPRYSFRWEVDGELDVLHAEPVLQALCEDDAKGQMGEA